MKLGSRLRRRGFTLIELLVVIMILAVLAALIVPRVMSKQDDAKRAKALTDIKALAQAMNLFKLDTGRYPASEEGFQALRQAPADVQNWDGPYTEANSFVDPWGTPYVYQFPGETEDDFIIASYGSDRAPGGTGDALDITHGVSEDTVATQ